MRHANIALWLLLGSASPAFAQLSINFQVPGADIGINLPVYPQLQRVPGYPVYYAPGMNSNYFFYDGLYWVFEGDNWYASSWYNGPWGLVDPLDVPVYVLRVPVRYYRQAPAFFHGWRADDAPQWGDHWGQSWEQHRSGWDQWNRKSVPAAAPLPTYQRQYSGSRYPQPSQQASIQTRNYRYQPKDPVAQQHFQQSRTNASVAPVQHAVQPHPAPVVREQQAAKQPQPQQHQQQHQPQHQPQPQQPQQQTGHAQPAEHKPQPVIAAHEPQAPRQQAQEKTPQGQEQGHEQGREKDSKDNRDNKEK